MFIPRFSFKIKKKIHFDAVFQFNLLLINLFEDSVDEVIFINETFGDHKLKRKTFKSQ